MHKRILVIKACGSTVKQYFPHAISAYKARSAILENDHFTRTAADSGVSSISNIPSTT